MTEDDFKKIESMLSRHIGTMADDFQHKLDLVVEGQQMLAQALEETRNELRSEIAKVDRRVTAVAADLSAHRADTEAHHGVYRVKES